jgi:hypothetical protein
MLDLRNARPFVTLRTTLRSFSQDLAPPSIYLKQKWECKTMAALFEAFPDPLDNWIVWDTRRDDFAMLGSTAAYNLSKEDAIAACSLLNKIAAGQLEDGAATAA